MSNANNDLAARAFRDTLGMFPTGVTVVTARTPEGGAVGVTVSSFNTVSLNPQLIVWSLSKHLASLPVFESAPVYAIHVLAEDQQDISQRFASKLPDRFAGLEVVDGLEGVPLLAGCCARFECRHHAVHPGGDHQVLIGEVLRFERDASRRPLVFQGGAYQRLA
ncbi:flavin reductase family protein [Zoogloea sp.]|uniref:flavin reductase family protein n=1 Tax=Zoogloea sp. TaxID=49181 RepID=UPI0035AF3D92|nr:flavin reductase family protein [Rhodocyclales bacterium]